MPGKQQSGQAKQRRAGKRPLAKGLEWTDDAILAIATDGKSLMRSSFAFDCKLHSVDDAALKTSASTGRLGASQPSPEKAKPATTQRASASSASIVQRSDVADSDVPRTETSLADYIEKQLRQWIDALDELRQAAAPWLPLHMFAANEDNSSTAHQPARPSNSCVLLSETLVDPLQRHSTLLESFSLHACSVLQVDLDNDLAEICRVVDAAEEQARQHVSLQYLCWGWHDAEACIARLKDCFLRRKKCEALLQYYDTLRHMPDEPMVVGQLPEKMGQQIMSRVLRTGHAVGVPPSALDEVEEDYRVVMNDCLFRASMLNKSVRRLYQSFVRPPPQRRRSAPESGLVSVASFSFQAKLTQLTSAGFLTNVAAVRAIQGAVAECLRVANVTMVFTDTDTALPPDRFTRLQSDKLYMASKALKQEWGQKTAIAIRKAFEHYKPEPSDESKLDFTMRHTNAYDSSATKVFLDRINLAMEATLAHIHENTVIQYRDLIRRACARRPPAEAEKQGDAGIDSLRHPLFSVTLQVSPDQRELNTQEIKDAERAVDAWYKSAEAKEPGAVCPLSVPEPRFGHVVECQTSMSAFCDLVAATFDNAMQELAQVPHVQKFVMERIFWPEPELMSIPSCQPPGWADGVRTELLSEFAAASQRVTDYVVHFQQYQDIINMDCTEYVNSLAIWTSDEAGILGSPGSPGSPSSPASPGCESRAPDTKDLASKIEEFDVAELDRLHGALDKLQADKATVEAELSDDYVDLGLFQLEITSLRKAIVDKYNGATNLLLELHMQRCVQLMDIIHDCFTNVLADLNRRPGNIEELQELCEVVENVNTLLGPVTDGIQRLLEYDKVLDDYKYKLELDYSVTKWNVVGAPKKIMERCALLEEEIARNKLRFYDDLQSDKAEYAKFIKDLESEVANVDVYQSIEEVQVASEHAARTAAKIERALERAKLINSREALFEEALTDYDAVGKIKKNFEPYLNLWSTSHAWVQRHQQWVDRQFLDVDAEEVEQQVEALLASMTKAARFFAREQKRPQAEAAKFVEDQIREFKPHVPIIVALRNPGMRQRHWEALAAELNIEFLPLEGRTLADILALDLLEHLEVIQRVAESAAKEYQIELALEKMLSAWDGRELDLTPYRETGTSVLRGADELLNLLDEHITTTQAMQFSAFKGPFESRIEEWNRKLVMVSDVLDAWLTVQRNWLYLQPIFESPDINKQLPVEGKKFATVDKNWRSAISAAKANPLAIEFCDSEKLLERFRENDVLLEEVQKGLSEYLETKRSIFTRFYFLTNEDLLSILSETKDVQRIQPHLKKCFEGIDKVRFTPEVTIDAMISPEGEMVSFVEAVDPKRKGVEFWMREVEAMMRVTTRQVMKDAIVDYGARPRVEWMQTWPGMCVLNGSQMHWTQETEELLDKFGTEGPKKMLERQVAQLADMVTLVRGQLSPNARTTVGALTVIDVHARDVMTKLIDQGVGDKADFTWVSQLRYYWDDDLFAEMVAARRPYGYEYLGNSFRLVITPLTDKCYLTLMGALQMTLGGAPAGPAGTGKTETTKDLSKALAMQCVVFNCSDGLDYIAMAKFFKGLASCGAWACFDEFNRINLEVLSVIGQQIMTIQLAIRAGQQRLFFEGTDIAVNPRFGVFITMNPGYAGRSELPDSLKALFRPVAMMVPDYALIGEIMFFAYGFENAKECGAKMVTTFKLCSEQLSSQPHYDYGMRAVKTVITAAGNLKRAEPDADEMVLLLRALQDVNFPKFLEIDLPLFQGIISDLFPGKSRPELDYGAMLKTMKEVIMDRGLQAVEFFVTKVIQLYEMIVVRHGLMLVGPTGGGKSSNLRVLQETLTRLKREGVKGFAFEKVKIYQLNPKSITMGEMYGQLDVQTQEWRDGIMSTMFRQASTSQTSDRKWIMFDGPVDAIWIENMNTVLDDNKKLCLSSGEIIKMSDEMTMMFEVEDLAVASPATVSRVGIIYMEPRGLGLEPLIQSWMQRLPESLRTRLRARLLQLLDTYVASSISILRTYLKEYVPTVDGNVLSSLLRILDCYFERCILKEGAPPPTAETIDGVVHHIEPLFIFALTWSIGATCDEHGRRMFDSWLRQELFAHGSKWAPPSDGQVYDFLFDLEQQTWVRWMTTVADFTVDPAVPFQELLVPTADSVRSIYLLHLLMSNDHHTLLVGPTGVGKTANVSQYLMGSIRVQGQQISSNVIPLVMTFSAQTSASMTQDALDTKMEKRRKGVFGPSAGKKFFVHIDDLNMPKREEYGAQPPLELIRQWFDQGGWYDRKDLSFRRIVDIAFICSMGPPGGGREQISARTLRHFNVIGCAELADSSKATIFGTITRSFLSTFDAEVAKLADALVDASIAIFNTVTRQLLPTPSKSHYTFNMRDLAKVFQGLLMGSNKRIATPEQLLRLWVHETKRVYEDRLVNETDHQWFQHTVRAEFSAKFPQVDWSAAVPSERLIFTDCLERDVDPPVYDFVPSVESLTAVVEDALAEYNAQSKTPMNLVLFQDALEHVARIARILRQPAGNALLLGVGGSGRQSMTKLAAFLSGIRLFQVEVVKGYGIPEWREDVKQCLMSAGLKERPTVFLFSDVQIVHETMLEDINNILNAADLPNLYSAEDLESIFAVCRLDCQRKRIQPTKLNMFAQYIARVRRNIHICLCMSPMGETFRQRLRMFPSLVNCCTIDWFTSWPADALQNVATNIINRDGLQVDEHLDAVVDMFCTVHQTVERSAAEYASTLRRHVYVTPTSYLELLSSFSTLLAFKREEVNTLRFRLQTGLDKLQSTKSQVSGMQTELKELEPSIVRTKEEVSAMMVQIQKDKEEADKTRAEVEVEEAKANAKAAEAKEIADDAQRDLDKALPALEEAVECLKNLKKSDIDEVKALRNPPEGVRLTLLVCCHFFEVPPVKKNDPNTPGKKIDDYWEAAQRNLLGDAKQFMNRLEYYDKDNIPDRVIQKISPYMTMEEFTPEAISKASKACTAICMWARAMHTYHFVALGVAPKRARLAEANQELAIVQAKLAKEQAALKAVQERLEELENNFQQAVEKQAALEKKEREVKIHLSNADKLIGGLGGEADRWMAMMDKLNTAFTNIVGDVVVAAGTISYLGPFTATFRSQLVESWRARMQTLQLPHTPESDVEKTLADPVLLRTWRLCGLPADSLSTQNGIIMANSRRWPLFIDPQGQANRFVRTLGKDNSICRNGMDVVKLSDRNFLRTLENGIQFGRWVLLENIGETLPSALEPILLQQKFKQGGQDVIRLGDSVVPYNDNFRLFMTTKNPNPHYFPDVQVKVSLLNFTITEAGLEEQLQDVVVSAEMPELAERKSQLVVQNAAMTKQLYDIETEILSLLSNSTGNILDDTTLIDTLAKSKVTSEEIKQKMQEGEDVAREIETQSENYRPVAKRAAVLFFCIADLAEIDPMYQYSLSWFRQLFLRGISRAAPASTIADRVRNLNSFFTRSVYANICRSLFERHKLLLSFLLSTRILQAENKVDPVEWRYLLSGVGPSTHTEPKPEAEWLDQNCWNELCSMSTIPTLSKITESVREQLNGWKAIFDDGNPHRTMLPAPFHDCTPLQRLCILRALRRDKVMAGLQDFVEHHLGGEFIEPPLYNLRACFQDSAPATPLIFVLSTGSDPNKDLFALADEMKTTVLSIALGQGQGAKAASLIEKATQSGQWVLLQNCHLALSWMPELERIVEGFEAQELHEGFRLWLTSMPSKAFPVAVLQNGVKMTKEPPKGIRANLKNTFIKMTDESLVRTSKPAEYMRLLFGLCFFHAVVIERKAFGPLGWNIPYEFNDTDLEISQAQLELYIDKYDQIPYEVLRQLTSVINYGGRITDDKDMRTSDIIVNDYFRPEVLQPGHKFSRSGIYHTIEPNPDSPHQSYMAYIDTLPLTSEPEAFGMHDNAAITCAISDADEAFFTILSLQPRIGSGSGLSREAVTGQIAQEMEQQLPEPFDLEAVAVQFPTDYRESLNTVLVQEVQRYNNLLVAMQSSLRELQQALQGVVVLSSELEAMGDALFDQRVPSLWQAKAYPSLKPLRAWFRDFLQRLEFITSWIASPPKAFWISGFFFPQGFLTAVLQNFARKYRIPIDTVTFGYRNLDEQLEEITERPTDGVYIHGLFLEGARWSSTAGSLVDPRPKELFSPMPVVHLLPEKDRKAPVSGIYRCPVYKILTRTGTLSTTGHSTNFVMWIEIPSNKPTIFRSSLVSETNAQVKFCDQDYWIRAGVACFCALKY